MKSIKRKEYKKIIKEFRGMHRIAQVSNSWVKLKDVNNEDVLMFVQGSIVKRTTEKYNSWEYKNFRFNLQLYGTPSLRLTRTGVEVKMFNQVSILANKENDYKILDPAEVEKEYTRLYNKSRDIFKFRFKKRD